MTKPQRKPRVAVEATQEDAGPEDDGAAGHEATTAGAADPGAQGADLSDSDDAAAAEEQGAAGIDATAVGAPEADTPDEGRPDAVPDASDVPDVPDASDVPASDVPDAPAADDRGAGHDGGEAGEEGPADDSAQAGPAPRLDGVAGRAAGEPRDLRYLRRTFDLNRSDDDDDDDDDDAAFGPKLAAWLQAYRERQASNGAGAARPVTMLPAISGAPASDDAGARQSAGYRPPPGPAGSRVLPGWANRAQAAYADMVAASTASRPPDWLVAGRAEPAPRRSARRLLVIGSLALLMAGTAAAAFVVAARQAGVDPSVSTALAALTEPRARPAAAGEGAAAAGEAESVSYQAASAPMPAHVEIVPTRVVAGPVAIAARERAIARPAAPPAGRSTLLLPTEKRADDGELLDHPQSAAPLARLVSSDAVEAAILAAAVAPVPQALAFAPGPASPRLALDEAASLPVPELPELPEPAAEPELPEPAAVAEPTPAPEVAIEEPAARTEAVRVASLEPATGMVRSGAADAGAGEPGAPDRAPDPDILAERAGFLLKTGDIVAARMLYELAARGGSAEAALGAGLTYDPAYFQKSGVRGIEPDAAAALDWYRMALGNGEKGALDEIERLEAWLRD